MSTTEPTNKFIYVDAEGDIKAVMLAANLIPYQQYGDYTAIPIYFEPSLDFSDTHYYKDGEFLTRDPRPGDYYVWQNEQWNLDSVKLLEDIRFKRNEKLYESDWTQLQDAPLTPTQVSDWAVYRQSLRDLPNNIDLTAIEHLDDITWPNAPV